MLCEVTFDYQQSVFNIGGNFGFHFWDCDLNFRVSQFKIWFLKRFTGENALFCLVPDEYCHCLFHQGQK